MWHVEHRILRYAPYRSRGLSRVDKVIGANRRGRDASTVEMNAIVHTARAARTSIPDPDNDQVTHRAQFLNHLRRHRFGRRGLATAHHIGKAVLGIENVRHRIQ